MIGINPNYEEGGVVTGLGTQRQMAANIFIAADNTADLIKRVDAVNEAYHVYDENGNSMMLAPFDTSIIAKEY